MRRSLRRSTRARHAAGPGLTAALVVALLACPGGDRASVAELEELGYFAYTPPANLEASREAAASGYFPFFDEGSGRFFWADAEDLAEGGVGAFLEGLEPTLAQLGIELGEVRDERSEDYDRYSVRVGGQSHVMWGPGEEEEGRALAAVRAFALVNARLAAAGSDERLYAVGGDNDMVAVLLTPALFEFFSARAEHESGKPYLPTEEPPWYGMPH